MSFSTRLKVLRAEHHMTQKELAERINVARTTITGYETKERQPSLETLNALASVFDVTVDYLVEDEMTPSLSSPCLQTQHERMLDEKVMKSYQKLSLSSKEEALKYLHLLELLDEEKAQR